MKNNIYILLFLIIIPVNKYIKNGINNVENNKD